MLFAILIYGLHSALFGYAARRVSEYRAEPDGFWWGFVLGAAGLLYVIFRKPSLQEAPRASDGSSIRHSWLCSRCGARNPAGKENCQSCAARRDPLPATRKCPFCGAANKTANISCFACGKTFEN